MRTQLSSQGDSSPLVSVIMPAYQSEQFIAEAIGSVLGQSMQNLELLVVDDGSTDRTVEIIEAWQGRDSRVRLIPGGGRREGPGPARNLAIAHASGAYIAFLDSDDVWYSRKLERQLQVMASGRAALCYSGYQRMTESGRKLSVVRPPTAVTRAKLLRSNVIACSTVVYDRGQLGLRFMPDLPRGQDYALWLDLLRWGPAHGVPEPLALYRVRTDSVSSNKWRSARSTWAVYREAGVTSKVRSCWLFGHYAVSGVQRRLRDLRPSP